ncbi:MAG: polysaccharide deacetylase family protein [bacterium]|nr:polysaccharide deacetylase family protein [bacterium]
MKQIKMPRLNPLQSFIVDRHESRPLMAASTVLWPRQLFNSFMKLTAAEPLPWLRKRAAFTLSFDCDFVKDVEAFPAVLELLKRYEITASFAIVGVWVERFPDLHKALVDGGHEIVNHTYSHPDNEEINPGRKFRLISLDEKREEIVRAHEIIDRVLGVECRGCRIPHFKDLFTPEIYGIISELGYCFDSSTLMTGVRSGGRPFPVEGYDGIWEIPLTTCPKHPLTVLDTWHSLHAEHLFYRLSHSTPQQFCNLFDEVILAALRYGGYVNVYLDPWDVPTLTGIEDVLARIRERRDELEQVVYGELVDRLNACAGDGTPCAE